VRFVDAVYVLHCFQKKITPGRLYAKAGNRPGDESLEDRGDLGKRSTKMAETEVTEGSTNVYADLGMPNAGEIVAAQSNRRNC
jgi:hypothetical protein